MKVSTVIKKMLTENTGVHMLDSGQGSYRHWQKNQGVDFDKQPTATLDFSVYGNNQLEVYPIVSLYHFLCTCLELDVVARILQSQFNKYSKSNNDSYFANMHNFLTDKGYKFDTVNTYNFDNSLSQVIQYNTFKVDDNEYIALFIHNGCDVRGGYTAPKFFKLDLEAFYQMDNVYTNAGVDFMGVDIIDSESGSLTKDLNKYFDVKDNKLYNKQGELAQAYIMGV